MVVENATPLMKAAAAAAAAITNQVHSTRVLARVRASTKREQLAATVTCCPILPFPPAPAHYPNPRRISFVQHFTRDCTRTKRRRVSWRYTVYVRTHMGLAAPPPSWNLGCSCFPGVCVVLVYFLKTLPSFFKVQQSQPTVKERIWCCAASLWRVVQACERNEKLLKQRLMLPALHCLSLAAVFPQRIKTIKYLFIVRIGTECEQVKTNPLMERSVRVTALFAAGPLPAGPN